MEKKKKLKIAIIILAVLLVLSGGGLAARYIYLEYFAPAQTTATVPDNLIGDSPDGRRRYAHGKYAACRERAGHGTDRSGRKRQCLGQQRNRDNCR